MKILQMIVKELKDKTVNTLAGYLESVFCEKRVYIYGAGCFGRELHEMCRRYGFEVTGFIDQAAGARRAFFDVPVYYPQQIADKSDCVILVGIVFNKKMRIKLWSELECLGFTKIVDGQSVRAHYVYAAHPCAEVDRAAYFSARMSDMENVYALLADEESRRTYAKNLAAHIKRDYRDCIQTDGERQYFVRDIPFAKGFSRFVDCGAYVGDTLGELCEFAEDIDEVVAFEPNAQNFFQLNECYRESLSRKIKRGTFFPCGVAGQTQLRRFAPAGGSSTIGEQGEDVVQCVAIDDAINGFAPTLIKMDIEGAEYEALEGSQKTIQRYKPDLAISVYHIIDHFYQIPLLIHSWSLGYRFYLRTHSSCCMETILYAVCPGGEEASCLR